MTEGAASNEVRQEPIDVVLRMHSDEVREALASKPYVEKLLWTLEGWHAPTARHSVRAAELVRREAEERGYDHDRLIRTIRGALIHDVGKRYVSRETLSGTTRKSDFKPAQATQLEDHSVVGRNLVRQAQRAMDPDSPPDEALAIVEFHHSFQPDPYPEFDARLVPNEGRAQTIEDIKLVALAEKIDAFLSVDGREYAKNQQTGKFDPMPYAVMRKTLNADYYTEDEVKAAITHYMELYPDNRGVAW